AKQDFPETSPAEELFGRSFEACDAHQRALRAAADFKRDGRDFSRNESARRIVIGKRSEERGNFVFAGNKTVPPVTIAVINDRSGAKNLLNTGHVLAGHGHNHVHKFWQAKGLLYDGAHGHVAGVL